MNGVDLLGVRKFRLSMEKVCVTTPMWLGSIAYLELTAQSVGPTSHSQMALV